MIVDFVNSRQVSGAIIPQQIMYSLFWTVLNINLVKKIQKVYTFFVDFLAAFDTIPLFANLII